MRFLLLALLLSAAPLASAQTAPVADAFVVSGLRIDASDPPPGSAVGRAGMRLPGGAYLHVVYGKPYARGRTIFGGVVGYDQIWSTGAHMATELVVTDFVTVGGQVLAPGVYALFTTPRASEPWTLHLNTRPGQHLADEYDPAEDALVTEMTRVPASDFSEDLVYEFVPLEDGSAELSIRWADVDVRVPIQAL
jgi:hypothetical protein